MSEKRRDSKGRLLRTGEGQRENGQYMFRYIDNTGQRKTVYSWKLVATDLTPNNKHSRESLRELEEKIAYDSHDGILAGEADTITVNSLFDSFMKIRKDLRTTTRCNYSCIYNKHIRDVIGYKKLSAVRNTDIQSFYIDLLENQKLKIGTVQKVNAILYQSFQNAVLDNIIRVNPTEGVMRKLLKTYSADQEKRHALTEDQQNQFIEYVYGSPTFNRWGHLFTVMLGTGMRIGEVLGLRLCDCDFENNVINVTHELLYKYNESGKYEYRISEPKTKAGYRKIPMFDEVRKAIFLEANKRKDPTFPEFEVDGYSGFIFLNSRGKVYTPAVVFDVIQRICNAYNKEEQMKAEVEKRDPCYLPRFSAHSLRHTFCTRMCENEVNIKIVQDIMGHKNSSTTMDIYNEATEKKKKEGFQNLEGKIKLA